MIAPSKLLNRNFVLLCQGQSVSQIGTQISSTAMLFWLKQVTESPSLMGTVAMLSGLAGALLGLIGGVFADRYSRRSIMIVCDLISASAVLSLSALMWLMPDVRDLSLSGVFAVSIVVAGVSSFFNPAISASTPDLVPKERLAGANSMLQASLRISSLLGLAIGGMLFRVLGAPLVLAIDGITYLLSAFSKYFITIPRTLKPKSNVGSTRAEELGYEMREALCYVKASKGLSQLLLVATFFNLFSAPILGLFPFYVEDCLKLPSDWYGYLLAMYGAGTLIGYLFAGTLVLSGNCRAVLLMSLMVFTSALYVLLGIFKAPSLIAAVIVAIGVASSFINVSIMTVLQITTPSEVRGRVLGLLSTITACLLPIGMGIAGAAASLVGKNISLIYVLCGACMALVTLIGLTLSGLRTYLSIGANHAAQIVSLNPQVDETAVQVTRL